MNIQSLNETRVMHQDDLQHIFGDAWKNICFFKFPSGQSAEVEFLTSDGNSILSSIEAENVSRSSFQVSENGSKAWKVLKTSSVLR